MDTIQSTKRGAITIPPKYRRLLKQGDSEIQTFTIEYSNGALILRPAQVVAYRSFSTPEIESWLAEDAISETSSKGKKNRKK